MFLCNSLSCKLTKFYKCDHNKMKKKTTYLVLSFDWLAMKSTVSTLTDMNVSGFSELEGGDNFSPPPTLSPFLFMAHQLLNMLMVSYPTCKNRKRYAYHGNSSFIKKLLIILGNNWSDEPIYDLTLRCECSRCSNTVLLWKWSTRNSLMVNA